MIKNIINFLVIRIYDPRLDRHADHVENLFQRQRMVYFSTEFYHIAHRANQHKPEELEQYLLRIRSGHIDNAPYQQDHD
ncbi:hypothetical protein C1E47_15880 [Vibrio cholerae]|nr:hypothetical protein [Vibrio cholerae]